MPAKDESPTIQEEASRLYFFKMKWNSFIFSNLIKLFGSIVCFADFPLVLNKVILYLKQWSWIFYK